MTQYLPQGRTASELAEHVERAVAGGRLGSGDLLPPIRVVAAEVGVSPATVSAAYARLRDRGIATGDRRRGTRIRAAAAPRMPAAAPAIPAGAVDLGSGNPDPRLLPDLRSALRRVPSQPRLYGEAAAVPELLELGRSWFAADGVDATAICIVGGALDGVERVLQARLRPGDSVAVEDPGYPGVFDLLSALGLIPMPVAMDGDGVVPAALRAALAGNARALVLTPRAQNPVGAALTASRVRQLRSVLRDHPDVLVVEDDHAGPVAGADCRTLTSGRDEWAVVRSVSKSLGPDLRVAVLAGDPTTVSRLEARQRAGAGWVSHVLQHAVVAIAADDRTPALLERARATYERRRVRLLSALADRGIDGAGNSGLNVWIPVPHEQIVVAGMWTRGWVVAAGERFRLSSEPGIRVAVARLTATRVTGFAEDLAAVLRARSANTRAG